MNGGSWLKSYPNFKMSRHKPNHRYHFSASRSGVRLPTTT